ERMVLDVDGEALLARHQAGALGDRPALQHAVHLQAQVVVQPPRRVLLDQVAVAARRLLLPAARLRRLLEIALLAVGLEAHQPALRRRSGLAACLAAFLGALREASALRRRASMRSTTFVSFGRFGALISRPSSLAFTSSASAWS